MSPSSLIAQSASHLGRGFLLLGTSFARRWRKRLLRTLLVALFIAGGATTAWSQICLPPLLGDRPRLQDMDKTGVLWLNLLLRQHEVCWRKPEQPGETRIFAIGNSAIYGFPWPSDLSSIGFVNKSFERQEIPAHLFNLGLMFTYQTKEAMVLSEALPYKPDFIVYGVTLDDLAHLAPYPYLPVATFFDANSRTVERLASDPPPTFEEPFRLYRDTQAESVRPIASWTEFREMGTFVRLAMEQTAKALRKKMFPEFREKIPKIRRGSRRYRCRGIIPGFEEKYAGWKEWSMLEYLAELRAETGVEVLVVNWPVAHEPRGACYNARYPTEAFNEYVEWMENKAAELELDYLDLHDLLVRREFVDSVHPTVKGQRKVARRLEAEIITLLQRSSDQ